MEKTPPDAPSPLVTLCHHRWSLPILALCADSAVHGAKFVTFASALGLSRETLSATLQSLVTQGWLARAAGVQHALRPEYVLTRPGVAVAPLCRAVLKELRRLNAEDLGLRKWSLPVISALAGEARRTARFNVIAAALPEATPRALAAALRDLAEADLITRSVLDTYPPTAEYRVAPRATRLAAAAARLASELRLHPTHQPAPATPDPFRLKKTA